MSSPPYPHIKQRSSDSTSEFPSIASEFPPCWCPFADVSIAGGFLLDDVDWFTDFDAISRDGGDASGMLFDGELSADESPVDRRERDFFVDWRDALPASDGCSIVECNRRLREPSRNFCFSFFTFFTGGVAKLPGGNAGPLATVADVLLSSALLSLFGCRFGCFDGSFAHSGQNQSPGGTFTNGGDKQFIWNSRLQSMPSHRIKLE